MTCPPPRPMTDRRRLGTALVAAALLLAGAAQAQNAAPPRAEIEAVIRDYLIKNPEIIQEALVELERRQRESEQAALRKITADPKSPLYVSAHHTVVGNPNGDVTLVEFFDYNCGFCKRGLADIQKVLDTDRNVRVVLKEFPILSPGSREASVVALALREQFDAAKLWSFHTKLMNVRGQIGREQALGVAKDLGADMRKLEAAMAAPAIQAALDESKLLADALGINGTPSYVVAEDLVVGARGYDLLSARIAAYRKCQKAAC
ncbi:MAG: DsbA family protein [Rhabdaerophilum calidifontis]